ncbi:MAG: ATP-binding protein [Bacteroidales bacterium]
MKRDVLFLLVFCAVLLLTLVLQHNVKEDYSSQIDRHKIQEALLNKQDEVESWFQKTATALDGEEEPGEINFSNIPPDEGIEDIALCVYKDDRLVYWNDNRIPYNELDTIDEPSIIKLDNGWYWYLSRDIKPFKAVGLILIKNMYPYENQYIEEGFQADFNLPSEVSVSLSEDEGIPFESKEGDHLLSLVPDKGMQKYPYPILIGSLYVVLFFLFLVFLFKLLQRRTHGRRRVIWTGVIIAGLSGLRFVMVFYEFPSALYKLPVFDPSHYATSSFIPSLGDLLLLLISIWFVLYLLLTHVNKQEANKDLPAAKKILLLVIVATVNVVWFVFSHSLLYSVIYNSNITLSFYNFFDITVYSVLSILAYLLIFVNYFLLLHILVEKISPFFSWKSFISIYFPLIALIGGVFFHAGYEVHGVVIVFFLVVNVIYTFFLFRFPGFHYSGYVLILFITVLFITFFTEYHSDRQERQKRQVLVTSLENERDRVGEYLFESLEEEMQNDPVLKDYMKEHLANESYIQEYLQEEYFHGYFRKYEMQISVCDPRDELEVYEDNSSEIYHCYSFFDNMLQEEGVPLENSNFYYLDNLSGRISYIGLVEFYDEKEDIEKTLYVSLDSKLTDIHLGYPELLLDEDVSQKERFSDYSYAKYQNNSLINRSGEFPYPTELNDILESDKEYRFLNYKDYNHLIYRPEENMTILISKENSSFLDLMAQFSNIFAFFFIFFISFMFLYRFPDNIKHFNNNFKNKIKISLIVILLVSLIVVGTATVYYTTQQFRNKQEETINEKLQSILVELENNLHMESELESEHETYLNNLLINLSNIFYVDMNLYDLNGQLIASSRVQVFDQGLLGPMMDAEAYRALSVNKEPQFLHTEKLGNLDYHSAYIPFYNLQGEKLAYLNVPYFTQPQALKKEVYTVIMVIANIYLFLIIIGTLVAVLVSNNITRPLYLIRNKLKKIGLNRTNEKIEYESFDEIGELIKEYNRMIDELEENARLLSQKERESAWREMAKQIAHEIKNPLTPMKLKVQNLKRAWEDKKPDFDERMKQFTKAMIDQINSLSAIASEFGDFAKMPRAKKERIDVSTHVKNMVDFFVPAENVKLQFYDETQEKSYVFADPDQLSRVMSNLLKNSIQSIPYGRQGKIEVRLQRREGFMLIAIQDNGRGVSEEIKNKLFHPNFTTKSGGMGMGLAISRKIIEDSGGEIWYETELGKGTTFYVQLPISSE